MANDWSGNPAVIDTTEDKTIQLLIHYLEYHAASNGDDLVVKDSHGNILWQIKALVAAPDNESEAIERSPKFDRWVQGINVETIDGGTLYIYLR